MIKRIKIQEKRTMTREEFITLSKDHILSVSYTHLTLPTKLEV